MTVVLSNLTSEEMKAAPMQLHWVEKIARITFAVYFFFIFFGTSMPFQERSQDVGDIGTSNILNQLIFTTLFLTSSLCLAYSHRRLAAFIKREKFLTIFLAWCLLSVVWSQFSFPSFKRLFQIFTTVTVCAAFLLNTKNSADYFKVFKNILTLYIFASFLSVALVPGAIDPDHDNGAWRCLAHSKNFLGQTAVVSILIWFFALQNPESRRDKRFSLLMLFLSLVLLAGTRSMTSILTFGVLAGFGALLWIDKQMKPMGVGHAFSALILFAAVSLISVFLFLAPEILASAPGLVGKDLTFTGRTDLWLDILDETGRHWLIGCGFSGFWVVDNEAVLALYKRYIWLPNEAHNGYLDLVNEVGVVGLAMLLMMCVHFFRKLSAAPDSGFLKWIVIIVLIMNLQESTLFRQNILTGVMFIFAYVAVFAREPRALPETQTANAGGEVSGKNRIQTSRHETVHFSRNKLESRSRSRI